MSAKTTRSAALPTWVPAGLGDVQKEATRIARTMRKRVGTMIPKGPAKELERLQARVERAGKDLTRARKRALDRVLEMRTDVVGRATKALRPIVTRLDVASRDDVDRLRKRLTKLERRLEEVTKTAPVA